MSLTTYGGQEAGGGVETALGGTTALNIIGPMKCTGRSKQRLQISAASDVSIRLNYLFSPDGGTTWVVGKQVATTTVTVDGGTAGYVASCTMEVEVGFIWKAQVYNTTAGAGKIVYEYRLLTDP